MACVCVCSVAVCGTSGWNGTISSMLLSVMKDVMFSFVSFPSSGHRKSALPSSNWQTRSFTYVRKSPPSRCTSRQLPSGGSRVATFLPFWRAPQRCPSLHTSGTPLDWMTWRTLDPSWSNKLLWTLWPPHSLHPNTNVKTMCIEKNYKAEDIIYLNLNGVPWRILQRWCCENRWTELQLSQSRAQEHQHLCDALATGLCPVTSSYLVKKHGFKCKR